MFIPIIGDGMAFTGTGDLFTALFLAHSSTKPSLAEALEFTVASLQAVLKNTLKAISPCGMINAIFSRNYSNAMTFLL